MFRVCAGVGECWPYCCHFQPRRQALATFPPLPLDREPCWVSPALHWVGNLVEWWARVGNNSYHTILSGVRSLAATLPLDVALAATGDNG